MDNIIINNAHILFRNFSGEPGRYNDPGDRNFCLLLDQETAAKYKDEGWNVKWLEPRDPGDLPRAYIPVKVKFKNYPPRVVLITSGGKTILTEETIGMLDYSEISYIDLIVRPYEWAVRGETGVTAYLKSMYVTLMEDEFERKYADVPTMR